MVGSTGFTAGGGKSGKFFDIPMEELTKGERQVWKGPVRISSLRKSE